LADKPVFEKTATRLWKQLGREDRLAASLYFWHEPHHEVLGAALAAIAKARHLRPQVARSLSEEDKARATATLLEPGESVAASLLVALHLGQRRPMLGTFLDAVGLPHENGLLKDAGDDVTIVEAAAAAGVNRLIEEHPRDHVMLYLNTLWLQDPQRWHMLEALAEALPSRD
jgi:hypothetical protein